MGNEDYGTGFISLHRSILSWEWYGDVNTRCLFIHLLLTAQYQDRRVKGKLVKRGQRLCSVQMLCEELGISPQKIRTALDHLKSTGEITSQSGPKGTVITIKNYARFQTATNRATNNQQTDNKLLTNKQQTTSNKRNKEINIPPKSPKGDGGVFELYAGGDAALLDALLAFEQMRGKIKRPMTDVARKRLTKRLDKLAAEYPGMSKADVLEEAVLHCWQSVYPPKEKKQEEADNDVL